MNVNTNGADLSNLAASADRSESKLGTDEKGTEMKVVSSGANVTPKESKEAPVNKGRELNSGPNVDDKTNSYGRALYEMTVRHNSTGGSTVMVREDR